MTDTTARTESWPGGRQELLAELGRRALEGTPLPELLDEVAGSIADVLDADYCGVLELVPGDGSLRLRAGAGWDDDTVGRVAVDTGRESFAGYALSRGEPVIVGDLEAEERFDAPGLLLDHGVTSGVSVAVGPSDDPWGLLSVYTTDRRTFTGSDAEFLRHVADLVGTTIERRRAEFDVDEVLARVTDGFYALDGDWNFEYVNGRARELIAPDGEDLVGRNVWEAYPGAVDTAIEEEYRRAMVEQSPVAFEHFFEPLSTWFDVRAHPSETGLSVYFRDVTDRKEMEQELREREAALERYREYTDDVLDAVDDVLYVVDERGNFQRWNRTLSEVTGYADAEIESMHPLDFVAEEDRERIAAGIGEVFETGSARVEARILAKDGRTVPHEFVAGRLEDPDGKPVLAGIGRDVSERLEHEQRLEQQREQLRALDHLNGVVREITAAVIDQSTREEIERTVCESLAETDSYAFAWVAEVDGETGALRSRCEAGIEGYGDAVSISLDPDEPTGPAGTAVRTRRVAVSNDVFEDPDFEPWREHAREFGYRSVAVIPIVHGETLYGVIGVYAGRAGAFEDEELEVVAQLGEIVGHAIAAVERKRALLSDDLVELRFRIRDVFGALDVPANADDPIVIDQTLPAEDDEFLVYGTATGESMAAVDAITESVPAWTDARVIDERHGDTRFELRLSDPPVLSKVASLGGSVERAVFEDGDYRMTLQFPPDVDVQRIIQIVQDAYPQAEAVARRQVSRPEPSSRQFRDAWFEELTERQRTTLQAAYFAGFFDWPRGSSGQDVAESMGIASPTFSQHLREAQRKLFSALLDDTSSSER